jgi:drug/metabolite transporter (DMT)-like permease
MTEQLAVTLAAASVGFVSAIFFCIGNAFNSVGKITLLSTSFWDFSEPVARALAAQRAQYVTGGLLLLASFALQVLAALASSTTPAALPQCLHTWSYLVPAVLVPTALASWWACRALDRLTIRRVLQRHQEKLAAQEVKPKSVAP